jgi:hypothetical protein
MISNNKYAAGWNFGPKYLYLLYLVLNVDIFLALRNFFLLFGNIRRVLVSVAQKNYSSTSTVSTDRQELKKK